MPNTHPTYLTKSRATAAPPLPDNAPLRSSPKSTPGQNRIKFDEETFQKVCPSFLCSLWARLEASPRGYRLAKGIFWSTAGTVISRGLIMAASICVARLLGKTGFGELGILRSTVGMFGVFAGFGLGLTATKYVAEFRSSNPAKAGRIIRLSSLVATLTGGLMALGMFLFAPWLAEHTLNAPHLTGIIRIGALVLFLNAVNGAQTGAMAGFEAFKTIARINLLVGLVSFPILVFGAYTGGTVGVAWGLAINLGIQWLLNHLELRREGSRHKIPYTFQGCSLELPILWRFSLPAVLGGILVGPVRWMCNALLVNQPDGYGEMGIFSAALLFQSMMLTANEMLNAPLLSMVSNAGDKISNRLGAVNILSSWIPGIFLAIPLLSFPEIALLIFGSDFETRTFSTTFALVVFTTCILTYRSGLLRVLVSRNRLWWGLWNNLLWAAVLLPATWFLSKWGAVGLGASFAIAYTVISIVFVPVYIKYCKVKKNLMISKEVFLVWLILVALLATSFCDISILYRIIGFPISLGLAGWALIKVWRDNTNPAAYRAEEKSD
ncbi:MAG: oligosaccharide flippase family protein [Acidobacteria bacterium]|nr:oligosaccharide flippase family protein [Acidobacteriota bacterium]